MFGFRISTIFWSCMLSIETFWSYWRLWSLPAAKVWSYRRVWFFSKLKVFLTVLWLAAQRLSRKRPVHGCFLLILWLKQNKIWRLLAPSHRVTLKTILPSLLLVLLFTLKQIVLDLIHWKGKRRKVENGSFKMKLPLLKEKVDREFWNEKKRDKISFHFTLFLCISSQK